MRKHAAALPLLALALAALPDAASAQGADMRAFAKDACWQRTYDGRHLAAHPKQKARAVTVAFRTHTHVDGKRVLGTSARFELGFGVMVKGDPELYARAAYCQKAGSAFACSLESDGGQLRITLEANGALRVTTDAIRIEGMKRSIEIGPESDDRLFIVPRTTAGACTSVLRKSG